MQKTRFVILLMVTIMLVGACQIQPLTTSSVEIGHILEASNSHISSGFDSENITVILLTPANTSEVSGSFNMTLNITSVNGLLNLTLFVDGEVYPDYNRTEFGTPVANTTVTRNVTVDTILLPEGNLNFTLLLEDYNRTPIIDKDSYALVFEVNNHGAPAVDFISPNEGDTMTGLDDILLNITADYPEVFLNITVDDEMTPEYNGTMVLATLTNHTLNTSRYENGEHTIGVTVYTEEGLFETVTKQVLFLDYVRFAITGLTSYSSIAGNQTFSIRIFSPYDNITLSVYINDELTDDVVNITLDSGLSSFELDTAPYDEGEHNFTFVAYDAFGHEWEYTMVLIVDNFGVPNVYFTGPSDDIVVGVSQFTVMIDSEWESVTVTVYVDDVAVESLTNITAPTGEYTFEIDTSQYTKWQHEIKIEVVTSEGESGEATDLYGFANIEIEEIISIVVLLGIAIFIPLYRKKNAYPLRPVLLVDIVFFAVVGAIFVALGVTSYSLMIWHFNLASIWAVGLGLVFANWIIPLLEGEPEVVE